MPILPNKVITIHVYDNAITVDMIDNNTLNKAFDVFEINDADKAHLGVLEWRLGVVKRTVKNSIEINIVRLDGSEWI